MAVVLDDVLAERLLRERARGEAVGGLRQGIRHALDVARGIDVALEAGRRLDPVADAVQARGERRGEAEVGIAVGPRDAAFDALRLALADDAEAGGAVVVAPGEPR